MSRTRCTLPALLAATALALAGCGGSDTPAASTGVSTPAKTGATTPASAVPGAELAAAEFAGLAQRGEYVGDPKAPFTLVEYGDLQCPACKFYADATLPAVVAKFVRGGQLRLSLRAFQYVGPDSLPAATYAWAAARQNKLHEFAKLWYLNQGDENSGYVTDAFAGRIAGGVKGLDVAALIRAAKTPAVRAQAKAAADDFAAKALQGTPSFLFGRTGGALEQLDLGDGSPEAAVAAIEDAITPG